MNANSLPKFFLSHNIVRAIFVSFCTSAVVGDERTEKGIQIRKENSKGGKTKGREIIGESRSNEVGCDKFMNEAVGEEEKERVEETFCNLTVRKP